MKLGDILEAPLLPKTLLIFFVIIWLALAIKPHNRKDWLLENLLVFVLLPILILTYNALPLSDSSYTFLTAYLLLHAVGAHYTYSEVPIGHWLKKTFRTNRNHYDRIVHVAFGFFCMRPLKEIFQYQDVAENTALMMAFASVLGMSIVYEILEEITARIVAPELGSAYLGAQGDKWDAYKDVLCALMGALLGTAVEILVLRF